MPPTLLDRLPSIIVVTAPSDFSETVPDEGPVIAAPQGNEGVTIINIPEPHTPAPVAADGEVILAVEQAWPVNFDPSIEGCPVITPAGVSVPNEVADQAISIGADHGVTIVKR